MGVERQWCGRLGKLDNCQVGVYLGYVTRREHTLIDFHLYLPKEWAHGRERRQKAGVAQEARFRTRHELALEMPDEGGPSLARAWVAGDDEMGRCSWLRGEWRWRGECYVLAVPSNTGVRDLAAAAPAVGVLVQARTDGRPSDAAETFVVLRERQGDGTWKHDYLLSNGPLTTPLTEHARVFKAERRIEDCLKRAKGEAGLAEYQVRTSEGWPYHQTLALLATWFLTKETRQEKIQTPALTVPQVGELLARLLNRLLNCHHRGEPAAQ